MRNKFLWTFSSVSFGLFYRTKTIIFSRMRIDHRNPCSFSITEIKETQTNKLPFYASFINLFVCFFLLCRKRSQFKSISSCKLLVFKWKFPSVDYLSIKRGGNVHTGVKISHIGSFNQNNLTIFSEMRKKWSINIQWCSVVNISLTGSVYVLLRLRSLSFN